MIGAVVGKHFFDFVSKKTSKKTQCFSAIYLIIYVIVKNIFPTSGYHEKPFWDVVIFTLCSFAVWSVVDVFFDKIKPNIVYSRSFPIYAMHNNVSSVITKLLLFCMPRSEWLAIPNFIMTVVLTLIVINFVCDVLERYFSKIYSIFIGNRIRNKS